jgi:DNA-directed RNA polymerase subunit RPC12/RpoP
MTNDSTEVSCDRCGQTFSAFLHQMRDQNAEVVCPNCRERLDCNPPKDAKPAAGAGPVKKTN